MMNGYVGFYHDKRVELYADSLLAAKLKAIEHFRPRKTQEHMVHVHLAEIDGEPVVQVADF